MKRLADWAGLALLCVLATGCRHRQPAMATITLPPDEPVPLEKAAEIAGLVPPAPVLMAPLPAVKVPVTKVKKVKKKTAPVPVAQTPVQVANAGAPASAESVVGALTAGGEDSPGTKKKAAELLTALEKRVAALSKDVVNKQPEQVARVKFFWSQAHAALAAGDADGAWNLATKAKVLLDDVAAQ